MTPEERRQTTINLINAIAHGHTYVAINRLNELIEDIHERIDGLKKTAEITRKRLDTLSEMADSDLWGKDK